jgi:Glycosyl transferase family 2
VTIKRSTEVVILIPTRNRSDLAMSAVRSVLDQPVADLQLVLSDNSTIDDDRNALEMFCRRLADSRLLYIAPPGSLSMTEHWDWAIHEALQRYNASYITYLTDRSLFKPGALSKILNLAKLHPEKVISYDWVTVFDHLRPITVERQPQTDQLLEVLASRLLFLSSRSIFPRCLPRMMNCCVPLRVVKQIQEEFGNVFASSSPDYNFAYRCLELVESILFYDHAAFVSYAIPRSTGAGLTGIPTDGSRDFLSWPELQGRPRNYAAPMPALDTGVNYIVHEYCLMERASLTGKFPRLKAVPYLAKSAKSLLMGLLYQLPLSVIAFLVALRSKMRRGPAPTAFQSVEDAINHAIRVPASQKGSVASLDPLRRE